MAIVAFTYVTKFKFTNFKISFYLNRSIKPYIFSKMPSNLYFQYQYNYLDKNLELWINLFFFKPPKLLVPAVAKE